MKRFFICLTCLLVSFLLSITTLTISSCVDSCTPRPAGEEYVVVGWSGHDAYFDTIQVYDKNSNTFYPKEVFREAEYRVRISNGIDKREIKVSKEVFDRIQRTNSLK